MTSAPTEASATPVFEHHAPVAFRAVSEHDQLADDAHAHRPNRKRHQGGEAHGEQPQSLQLVETQSEASVAPAEDDLPRRTKPRRRRAQPADSEPLKLVETQPGTQPQDGSPTS